MVTQNPTLPAPQKPVPWNKNYMHVPFRDNVMTDAYNWNVRNVEWRHVFPFKARMKFVGFERGRSASNVMLLDPNTGTTYRISDTHFAPLMQRNWYAGRMTEEIEYSFRKQGSAYFVLPLDT